MSPVDHQERANTRMWQSRGLVRQYATTRLADSEKAVLDRFRADFAGSVLEIGCGAGRVTGHTAAIAADMHAVDISPEMLAVARARYPGVRFDVGDLRDLSSFPDGDADVVAMWCNVVDILGHGERMTALAEVARILRPGGLLVLDTHNLASASRRRRPTDLPHESARQFVRSAIGLPVTLYNHRRLSRRELAGEGFAILNDEAHRFRALHYYVDRAEQERQLAAAGFDVIEIVDVAGAALGPQDDAPASASLKYVARRRA